jgi:uncharacterized protein (TIRG00374 family)
VLSSDNGQAKKDSRPRSGWRGWLWNARRPLRRLAILLILALIVEYLVIPELVGASKDFYLLGRLNVGWMVAGLILEGLSLFCYALLNRVLLPPEGRPGLSRLFRIDLVAAAVAHVIPAGTIGSAGIGFQLFTAEGIDGTDVGVMMATKGMGSTLVLNVLLWISLVISIPLSGFRPIYETVAVAGAVVIALMAALVIGLTRGEKRAARILHAIGERIPGMSGDRLEQIVLQAAASIRSLGRNRAQLAESLSWASLNWLLDAASLWCFIAAFGHFSNPIGLFAVYGIANVLAAIPLTPGGLGVIDTVIPLLLVGFGLTRSVATLGVLSWRLVNFWLPIPAGAVAYATLKVPRGAGLRAVRRAFGEMTTLGARLAGRLPGVPDGAGDEANDGDRAEGEQETSRNGQQGRDQAVVSPETEPHQAESRDGRR